MTGHVAESKDDPRNAQWPPSSGVVTGNEVWNPPESWGVPSAPPPKLPVVTPEDVTSDDLDQSDYGDWGYGNKKPATLRIFRPDTTYTTVNCSYQVSASELCALLGRKIFKPDTSKYHLYMSRNNVGTCSCQLLPVRSPLASVVTLTHCWARACFTDVSNRLILLSAQKFALWNRLRGRYRY